MTKPIELHYWPTPNGIKITIMLEECGLAYEIKPAESDAKRTVNTMQAGQRYDDAGQLVMTSR